MKKSDLTKMAFTNGNHVLHKKSVLTRLLKNNSFQYGFDITVLKSATKSSVFVLNFVMSDINLLISFPLDLLSVVFEAR